jgi:hypothetical protein
MIPPRLKAIVWLAALFVAALPASSQTARIEFSSEVTEVVGSPLAGVTVGSMIALAQGRCRAGLRYLRTFQKVVRAQVLKSDPRLADRLISGARTMINAGCVN